MAHIRKRYTKDGKVRGYEARYRFRDADGRVRVRAKTFRTRYLAEQFLRTKIAELELGTHVDPHRSAITFEDLPCEAHLPSAWRRMTPPPAGYRDLVRRRNTRTPEALHGPRLRASRGAGDRKCRSCPIPHGLRRAVRPWS